MDCRDNLIFPPRCNEGRGDIQGHTLHTKRKGIALFITAGTAVVFGETLTNPADIVARVDNLFLTVVAAVIRDDSVS